MSTVAHPLADIFLLGFIVACSLVAALFFLQFWRSTRDILFLAFAVFFLVEAGTRAFVVSLSHPNEGSIWMFLVRLIAVLGVLGAILVKNAGNRSRRTRTKSSTMPVA
ncbi:MAG: DUF5985 family protein [Acidobacteriaceae bacterium]